MIRKKQFVIGLAAAAMLLSMAALAAAGQIEGLSHDTEGILEQSEDSGTDDYTVPGGSVQPGNMFGKNSDGNQNRKYGAGSGVLIADILVGSPADAAGLMRGDTITAVDGIATADYDAITTALQGYEYGDQVELTIIRADEEMRVPLTLETRIGYPLIGIIAGGNVQQTRNWFEQMPFSGGMNNPWAEDDSQPGIRNFLNLPEVLLEAVESGTGAVVNEVTENGPADAAGVESGMVILKVDGEDVADGDLATVILGYQPGDTVVLTAVSLDDGEESEISVVLGENDGNPLLGVSYYPVPAIVENGMIPGMGGYFFDMPGMNQGQWAQPRFSLPDMQDN